MAQRRIILLTEGFSEPVRAKTATSLLRYKPEEVVAVYDTTQAGKQASELFGVGGSTPMIGSLDDADTPNTLLIGIAPQGGRLPAPWKKVVLEAIARGMDIVSGLHDFLSNDDEIRTAAEKHGVTIHDVRKNTEHDVSTRQGIREDCLRLHTVGHDCSIGKMVTSVEMTKEFVRRGHDAKFVATGQTGIMIEGDGCPVDCVVSDFVNGAVEKLILANQHHDILVFEGQGSLAHPCYSAVTAGLLHGCIPHGMIMVYEAGRTAVNGMPHIPLHPLPKLIEVYEAMASLHMPSKVIGVSMNSRNLTADQARAEQEAVSSELGLPVTDVYRDGAGPLVEASLALRAELFSDSTLAAS